jgi:hypothetical protein
MFDRDHIFANTIDGHVYLLFGEFERLCWALGHKVTLRATIYSKTLQTVGHPSGLET